MARPQYRLGKHPSATPRQGKHKYPWHLLKATGDCFLWNEVDCYESLRSSAWHQTKVTGVRYTVNLLDKQVRVTRL